jgi:hypothetical protein
MDDMSQAEMNIALSLLLYGGFAVFVEETVKGRFIVTISTEDGDEVICRNVSEVIEFFAHGRSTNT